MCKIETTSKVPLKPPSRTSPGRRSTHTKLSTPDNAHKPPPPPTPHSPERIKPRPKRTHKAPTGTTNKHQHSLGKAMIPLSPPVKRKTPLAGKAGENCISQKLSAVGSKDRSLEKLFKSLKTTKICYKKYH